jgi:hypothetical protein
VVAMQLYGFLPNFVGLCFIYKSLTSVVGVGMMVMMMIKMMTVLDRSSD